MSLNVAISAQDAGFSSTISKVKNSVESMDEEVKQTSKSVNMSFGAMAAAGAGFAVGLGIVKAAFSAVTNTVEQFGAALDLGGELNDLSSRTGETAGNLMVLQRAFDNSGVGADKVGTSINKLQQFMENASEKGSVQEEIMSKLGLTYSDLAGKTPTEQMQLLAERIAGIEDPAKRADAAMDVFGQKLGGKLLPLINNFAGEVKEANMQLGSMPKVMDLNNVAFDGISDNIQVIKGKFLEFAAGLLGELAPAIELVTKLLSYFDAAAVGIRLGEIITGGSVAMQGFSNALEAAKIGEFGKAFEIAFASIKLQAALSINSIVANVQAAGAAIGEFLKHMFNSDGALMQSILSAFQIVSNRIAFSVSEMMRDILRHIPGIGQEIDQMLYEVSANAAARIGFYTDRLGDKLGEVPAQFVEGLKAGNAEFDRSLATSKELIDTTGLQNDLENKKLISLQQQTAEEEKQKEIKLGLLPIESTYARDREINADKIAELERDIVIARSQGNDELAQELEISKVYYKALEDALKMGIDLEDAIVVATKARSDALDGVLSKNQGITGEMAKQVTFADRLQAKLDDGKSDRETRGEDRVTKRLDRLVAQGNKRAAQKTIDRVNERARFEAVRNALDGGNSSLIDLAKQFEVDTFKKHTKDLLEQLETIAKIKVKEDEEREAEKEKKKPDPKKLDPKKPETLEENVKHIRDLMKKLESKLPQHALT